ncbi:hypothetical protein ACQRIU_005993 [Beauveria bassiana]
MYYRILVLVCSGDTRAPHSTEPCRLSAFCFYCFDIQEKPDDEWEEAQRRVVPEWGGQLVYCQQDVRDAKLLEQRISQIADENGQLNGVVAAAAFIQTTPALDYSVDDISSMLATNYTSSL